LAAIFSLAVGCASVHAQTDLHWDGSSSGSWGTAANWNTQLDGAGADIAIGSGNNVIFSITGGGANLTTTLGGNRTINSLEVNGNDAGAISIGGNRLTINGGGMDLSAAMGPVSISSDITVNANQTWLLDPGETLTLTNDVDGSARTLTINGGGGATLSMGQGSNNASDIGNLILTNNTTLLSAADNQFNDYQTVVEVQTGSTWNRNNFPDALSGIAGGGSIINFSGGTINRDLDIRPPTDGGFWSAGYRDRHAGV
jgi:hypothetical protein